ncbi:hypothetical protein FB451DRAFT_1188205 [Mycena latifolia]|nr:hypothetical protein FB451DRAFT_1188205 [Mycena latifolia]
MSTNPRPDSGMAAVTAPRRISMACVKCRAGKVKVGLGFYPASLPDDQARSGSTTDAGRCSRKQPPPPSAPMKKNRTKSKLQQLLYSTASRGYGGSDRGGTPYPVQGYFPPQSSSQFNPGPVGPTPVIEPNRYPPQPQNHVAGDYIPYNFAGTVNHPHLAHPSPRLPNQQPGAPGYPSEYQQYFANFGLNDISYPAAMLPRGCTCVPGGPCYCGGTR